MITNENKMYSHGLKNLLLYCNHFSKSSFFFLKQKKEPSKSSVKKKLTKVAEAKKVMKRNFKVNKKITFTDEGEVRFYKCVISELCLRDCGAWLSC